MIDKQTAAQAAAFIAQALNQAFGGGGLDLLIKLQAEINAPDQPIRSEPIEELLTAAQVDETLKSIAGLTANHVLLTDREMRDRIGEVRRTLEELGG